MNKILQRMLLLLIVCLTGTAAFEAMLNAEDWRKYNTSRYDIRHISMLPPTLIINISSAYKSLRAVIPDFVRAGKDKTPLIYIYPDKKSYLEGEFKPPQWSDGLMFLKTYKVVVFIKDDQNDTVRTIAHELSHMYTGLYFAEKNKTPPLWFDEGIATMVEDSALGFGSGIWTWSESRYKKSQYPPISQFISTKLDTLEKKDVDIWYTQAFSIAKFLNQKSISKFSGFCKSLRDDEDLAQALKKNFNYGSLEEFEKEWRAAQTQQASTIMNKSSFLIERPEQVKIEKPKTAVKRSSINESYPEDEQRAPLGMTNKSMVEFGKIDFSTNGRKSSKHSLSNMAEE